MAGATDGSDEQALWRRWRSVVAPGADSGEPSPLELAAYAENRLSEAAAEAIEAWLATNPVGAQDVLAARRAGSTPLPSAAPDAVVARAAALVGGGAAVLPFRRSATLPRLRQAVGWGAMAASIVAASLVGFALSSETYLLSNGGQSASSFSQQLIDPPTGLFNGLDEDSAT